ncbi:response regulator transcription factor [Novosphingobium sp.]|uniref:response regulator transcription factor n=1 Tax=Novosphingobium sp. TaxID=1874826 RepID=UPI00345C57D4
MTAAPPVYIVDDDASLRNSLRFLLTNAGREVHSFESGEQLLSAVHDIEPGPILLDVRMAGVDGLEVQQELANRGCTMPVIIITGHGDIAMAVRAMRAGAVDFLTKPFARRDLLNVIDQADARLATMEARDRQFARARDRLEVLTRREYEVLNELARGLPNKSIGYDLGISPRTVEIHRANVMRKLDVHSFPDVLRIAFAAGMPLASPDPNGPEDTKAVPLSKARDHSEELVMRPDPTRDPS